MVACGHLQFLNSKAEVAPPVVYRLCRDGERENLSLNCCQKRPSVLLSSSRSVITIVALNVKKRISDFQRNEPVPISIPDSVNCPRDGIHKLDEFETYGRARAEYEEFRLSTNFAAQEVPLSLLDESASEASYKFLQGQSSPWLPHILDDSLYKKWIATHFSAVLKSSPSPKKQESEHSDDYYVNVGYALRTIREETPCIFQKEITFSIYRADIVFRDPMNSFSGIENYKRIFWALRFHGKIFFKGLQVDVLRIWQPSDKVIMVRWCVRGIPRVPWEAQGSFDGTSEYKLDKNGRIYEHRVDNVVMNDRRAFAPISVADLLHIAGVRQTPTPTYFGQLSATMATLVPLLVSFSWIRLYAALKSTVRLSWPCSSS